MFVGYPKEHDSDTYEMWDPITGGIHVTRDVIWLKRMYHPDPKKEEDSILIEPMFTTENEHNA